MLENLNLSKVQDIEQARKCIVMLLNLVESLKSENEEQREQIQRLRDESIVSRVSRANLTSKRTSASVLHPIIPLNKNDVNPYSPYWDNSVGVFNDSLYISTCNWANGGEVWLMLRQVFLPLVLRNR